ncbi:MAG: hypothetical protein HY088_08120 [Ignavibacteriales bacterium]|nr:hypothetical protein [Ignavibacteriales bacterium]
MKKNDRGDLLKELEIKKIQSEIARNEEERLKIEFERGELERKAKLPWYKKKELYKLFGSILVFVTISWFYADKLFVPLMQAENTRLTLDNQQWRENLSKQEKKFQEKEEVFRAEYVEKMKEQRAEYTRLKAQEAQLAARYKNLSNSLAISETEKLRYLSEYKILARQVENKDNLISNLSSRIQSEEVRKYIGENVSLSGGAFRNPNSQLSDYLKSVVSPTVTNFSTDSSWTDRLGLRLGYSGRKANDQNLSVDNVIKSSSIYNFGRTDSVLNPFGLLNLQTQRGISYESTVARVIKPVTSLDSSWFKIKR